MWNPFKKKKVVETTEVQKPTFIITQDGNMTVVWKGEGHCIGKSHPCYDGIRAVFDDQSDFERLDDLLIPGAVVERELNGVTVDRNGVVFWNGSEIHSVLANRIGEFMRRGEDWAPLALFMENLMGNPSERAIDELYGFLENEGMAITEDGCFMGYKGVTDDYLDKHSRTCDNSVGQVLEMPRGDVDDDAHRDCSHGFHVGSHKYASSFASPGGRVMLVKVNPADAVSVPHADAQKLRVCKYEVIEESEKLIETPVYRAPDNVDPNGPLEDHYFEEPDEDEDDYCEHCGESGCFGECQDEEEDCDEPCDDCKCDDLESKLHDAMGGKGTCDPPIDPRTGRARGTGGRFLPRN